MSLVQLYKNPIPITQQTWPEQIKPLVSISCITYNHENYIRDAIEGFLIQKTTFPVEILIHDDASTDNTANIIREYEAKYPQLIKPIYQTENQYSKKDGTIGRIQRGRACGKYYAICEGDDYWTDPLKLQKQVDFLEENSEYSMCFHNAMLIYEGRENLNKPFKKIETREYSGEEILKEWTIPTASVVFRMDAYKPVHHPDFLYGDIILFLSLAENGKIWGMSEVMGVYRKHEGGMTSPNKNGLFKTLKYIKHHEAIKVHFGRKYEQAENEILSKAYIGLSKNQLKKYNLKFIKSLIVAFKQEPSKFRKHFLLAYFKIS